MQRVCFLLKVRPDRLEEYRSRHRAVWPDMLAALRETGWHNYSLFLREDGLITYVGPRRIVRDQSILRERIPAALAAVPPAA